MKRNNFLKENTLHNDQGIMEKYFPEINWIKNNKLRKKVSTVWAVALEESNFENLNDVGKEFFPKFSIIEHIRSVTNMSMAIFESLKEIFPDLVREIDKDTLIAGALCHDVGILFERDPINKKKWSENISLMGNPALRHPVYGVSIALRLDLPLRIVHIIGAHSPEGELIQRSLECSIVHHADYLWWEIFARKEFNKPAHHEKYFFGDTAEYYMNH